MTSSKHMKEMRLQAGLTREQLAAKAGVSRNTVYHVEAGINSPVLITVECLAEALGLTLDEYTGFKKKGEG